MSEPRKSAIIEALDAIPEDQKLQDPHLSPLDSVITHKALESTLRLSKRGSAAGPDTKPNQKSAFLIINTTLHFLINIQQQT